MTPYELGVLLHYYAIAVDHPDMMRNPPVWQPTINLMLNYKLIEPNGACDSASHTAYRITERGRHYIEQGLCRLPLPQATWIIPPLPPFEESRGNG